MEVHSSYKIDSRTASDIRKEITGLARVYAPEWKFDVDNPDIGSVIGLIFAEQMQGSILRFNQMLENYRIELVNMLGISSLPARPAHAIAVMRIQGNTAAGVKIPKATKLMGTAGEREIIFETLYDMYVTGARLTDVVGISGRLGRIIPLYGKRRTVDLFGEPVEAEAPELEEMPAIPLFSYEAEGVQRQALLFYHSYLYDVNQEEIGIRFHGEKPAEELAGMFMDRDRFCFSYLSEEGIIPYERVSLKGDTIFLYKQKEHKKRIYHKKEMAVIILEMISRLTESIEVNCIEFKAGDGYVRPSFIHNGSMDMETQEFAPFGEQLSLYQECFIGQDMAFSKQNAKITLKFTLEFRENQIRLMPQEEENLAIVKRKPRREYGRAYQDCLVQEISIEYFNQTGWKKLPVVYSAKQLFAQRENTGEHEISFQAPPDWSPVSVGGYDERCIRIRVERADNCYMRPARHYYPLIRNMEVAYSFHDEKIGPEELVRVCDNQEWNLTHTLGAGESFTAFSAFSDIDDSMYFGFDKKFEGGPVSILLELTENPYCPERTVQYEYSTVSGFRPLKLIDNTQGLQNSGTILFQPPLDMGRQRIDGRNRYWIRMVDDKKQWETTGDVQTVLNRLLPNAADCWNVQTGQMQEYVIDVISPNMSFDLGEHNILGAQVWVNEKEQLSLEQMMQMLKEQPGETEAEYNLLGEIEEFYVHWTEVENFDASVGSDRHYMIERTNSRILFGDGVNVQIPRNIRGIAFKVRVNSCDGEEGNIPAEAIQGFHGNMLFVDEVYNPLPAFGGSGLEDTAGCLKRGSNVLCSGRRLVSENDYIQEIMAFSNLIAQVKCICGRTIQGDLNERRISLVLLMKGYQNGSYAFRKLKKELMEYLPARCELQYREEEIEIVEPVFVRVSVDIWISVPDAADSFALQGMMQEQIEKYLDPAPNDRYNGWRIGSMPKEKQIRMMLSTLEKEVSIEKYTVHAAYSDGTGRHETTLEQAQKNPFAVCCNGSHHINVIMGDGKEYVKQ